MMVDHLRQYSRLFRIPGLRLLIDDIWMSYYKRYNAIAVYSNGVYTSYLPQKHLRKCLVTGVELFSDSQESAEFFEELQLYSSAVISYCESLLLKEVTLEDLQRLFTQLATLFSYYSRTEFFYTDAYFANGRRDELFSRNSKLLADLKNQTREILNTIYFGEQGYLQQILKKLSLRFSVSVESLHQYTILEIYQLFGGKQVDAEIIKQRNTSFVIISSASQVEYLYGKEAGQLISQLEGTTASVNHVTGQPANSGVVRGKAKVLVSGFDNFDALVKLMGEMQEGQILVSETTSPELTIACQKAAAIVTDQGGMLSHAAIISRELRIPCIVGAKVATKIFKDGDLIEVDANQGIVRKI